MADESVNITWHEHLVSRQTREQTNGHRGCVVWFTGLSGSGKSTVANEVEHRLQQLGIHTFLLDGDNLRHGLNASPERLQVHGQDYAERFGLGFGAADRAENIRRVGDVAQLFASAGLVTLTAFVSPYRVDRDRVRQVVEAGECGGEFVEIFVDAPLEVCETRDPKGLYKQARAGKIKGFTGIDDPYEPPLNPELVLKAAAETPDRLAATVIEYLQSQGILPVSDDAPQA